MWGKFQICQEEVADNNVWKYYFRIMENDKNSDTKSADGNTRFNAFVDALRGRGSHDTPRVDSTRWYKRMTLAADDVFISTATVIGVGGSMIAAISESMSGRWYPGSILATTCVIMAVTGTDLIRRRYNSKNS